MRYELLDSFVAEDGKTCPSRVRHQFNHGDTHVDYTISMRELIDSIDAFDILPEPARQAQVRAGMHTTYQRYQAIGGLRLTIAGETVQRSGSLIHEFMYPGAANFADHV